MLFLHLENIQILCIDGAIFVSEKLRLMAIEISLGIYVIYILNFFAKELEGRIAIPISFHRVNIMKILKDKFEFGRKICIKQYAPILWGQQGREKS